MAMGADEMNQFISKRQIRPNPTVCQKSHKFGNLSWSYNRLYAEISNSPDHFLLFLVSSEELGSSSGPIPSSRTFSMAKNPDRNPISVSFPPSNEKEKENEKKIIPLLHPPKFKHAAQHHVSMPLVCQFVNLSVSLNKNFLSCISNVARLNVILIACIPNWQRP